MGRGEGAVLDENLGFVATANRGLQLALESAADAVLLNSDTRVPMGWLTRLQRRPGVKRTAWLRRFRQILRTPCGKVLGIIRVGLIPAK